jgi:hypothetical protein
MTRLSRRDFGLACAALAATTSPALAEPMAPAGTAYRQRLTPQHKSRLVVPGSGPRVAKTGDDFEDPAFVYYPQHPKSSWNIDDEVRVPGSYSSNWVWAEGAKRGTPDVVKRIATPPGGLEGSQGALLIQTLYSGVPGRLSNEDQQDDLLHDVTGRIGREIPLAWTPNVVCRVFIPPETQWERRNGASFGFRTGINAYTPDGDYDEYWPGIFFWMQRERQADGKIKASISVVVRADEWGRDLPMLTFEPSSWCTLGISHTPDGRCHFFARAGVENLTADDHLGSYMCYNWRGVTFTNFFFNVMNFDNGRSWSTPWVIDDAMLHVASPPNYQPPARMATRP